VCKVCSANSHWYAYGTQPEMVTRPNVDDVEPRHDDDDDDDNYDNNADVCKVCSANSHWYNRRRVGIEEAISFP